MIDRTPATDAFWAEFAAATGTTGKHTIASFGSSPEAANELASLVAEGRKRATSTLVGEREAAGQSVPEVGDHWIVVDGEGRPVSINRTVEVRVGLVGTVDDDFAWDEGEGDRGRESWLRRHQAYFGRRAEREGLTYSHDEQCVFERFVVVWPPDLAELPHPIAFDLTERYVHLGPSGRAAEVPVGPDFWAAIGDRADLASGRLVMISRSDSTWPHWERHPEGEELVMVLTGRADLVLEMEDGDHVVELREQQSVLVPPGIWHRAVVHEPARILTITAGRGTEHRPRR